MKRRERHELNNLKRKEQQAVIAPRKQVVESESEEEVYRPAKRLVKVGALEETKQIKRPRAKKADSESEEKPVKRQKVEP